MEERLIGELATPIDPIPGGWTCEDVHRLFRDEPDLVSVAVQVDGRAELLNRSHFHELMVGSLGYGWALYGQQSIRRLLRAAGSAPRFGHDRPIITVGLALLSSPVARNSDDVLVDLDGGAVGLVPTRAVFAELRRAFDQQTLPAADPPVVTVASTAAASGDATEASIDLDRDQPSSAVT